MQPRCMHNVAQESVLSKDNTRPQETQQPPTVSCLSDLSMVGMLVRVITWVSNKKKKNKR